MTTLGNTISSDKLNNANKSILRNYFNTENGKQYKSIQQINKDMNSDSSEGTYDKLREMYNQHIKIQKLKKDFSSNLKNKLQEQKDNLRKQYKVRLNIDIEYYYKDKDGNSSKRLAEDKQENNIIQTLTFHAKNKDDLNAKIDTYVKNYDMDGSEAHAHVKSHSMNVLDVSSINENARSESKQLMKASFIIKSDWLKYAQGIAKSAFIDTDGECVYYQLSKFLNNPPTGNKKEYIGHRGRNRKTDKQGLFEFFQENVSRFEYPNFNIKSGVSTEMIMSYCIAEKRSFYAYNSDNKCFSKYITDSKHYCPIIYYKMN